MPLDPRVADWSPVGTYLDAVVADGGAPGAVLGVSAAGHRWYYSTGRLGQDDATRPDSTTIYDLASLTKVVGLTTAAMLAVDDRRLDLDAPVQRYVPAFRGSGKESVTVRRLLAHASGLPGWRPLFRETATRAEALALTDSTPLEAPPGARELYSDLGAIVLTQAVEAVEGERIDALLARRVFGPLGLASLRYSPPPEWMPRIAPTENDPWRGHVLRGEVHDENAARLDGVSGHAGLFGDADDLVAFGEWMLARSRGGARRAATDALVRRATIREFTRRADVVAGSSRALGWDLPSPASSAGARLSPSSFGHTGFTGTSIWIDPERQLVIVLLSNRVHPTRDNQRWAPVRARVADLVVQTLFPERA
jgi:CubicO group peptidase (beta-lactamase class C family)